MTKQEAIQAQIDDIMDTFEFERVHAWMEHDGWTWGDDGKVPSVFDLRRCARDLLKVAASSGYCATGGFIATGDEGTDESGPWIQLNLSFGYMSYNDGTAYTE
jgi:hypothetical protein